MSLSVLIVEDEVLIALETAQCIERNGFEVCGIANNPQEAYNLAYEHKPQIIVMDINLSSDETGVDVVKKLNKNLDCSIIYLTSYCDQKTLEEVSKTEFAQYLIKPYRETELIATLELIKLRYESFSFDLENSYIYNPHLKELKIDDNLIILTYKESCLFHILHQAKGQLVNLDVVDYEIWPNKMVSNATKRSLVYRLRQKLPCFIIKKESNMGYRLLYNNN